MHAPVRDAADRLGGAELHVIEATTPSRQSNGVAIHGVEKLGDDSRQVVAIESNVSMDGEDGQYRFSVGESKLSNVFGINSWNTFS